MSATEADVADITTRATQRLLALDPLLAAPAEPSPGCGATFTATGSGGTPIAIAGCRHWAGEPGSLSLTWGAARRFQLVPQISGPAAGDALDQLMTAWRDHLAEVPAAREDDTAAVVSWPSRDVEGIRALQRHGLAPFVVTAARATSQPHTTGTQETRRAEAPGDGARGGAAAPGVQIRLAGPADVAVVTQRGLELVRYDAHFGAVIERPQTEAGLRQAAAEMLAAPEPWVWIAERDGVAVGLLTAERPETATWIAPLTRLAPAAYLQQLFVLPGERGTGIGALLTGRFHAEIDAAGIPVTVLHHGQVNPLSAPFWSQQGYRPLWTTWEARPARTLR